MVIVLEGAVDPPHVGTMSIGSDKFLQRLWSHLSAPRTSKRNEEELLRSILKKTWKLEIPIPVWKRGSE